MSTIEWLARPGTKPESWNPVTGCRKVSEGCRNCYAEGIAARFWGDRKFTDVRCHKDRLDAPLHWRTPRTVFVNSMSDLFHEAVPDEFIDKVFLAMSAAGRRHTFIVLTKRPGEMQHYAITRFTEGSPQRLRTPDGIPMSPQNVWLGVSVEDQATADARIPILLTTPAAVRFISAEPLLGPVDLSYVPWPAARPRFPETDDISDGRNPLRLIGGTRLDWVIVGGESGPKARPCDVAWIRSIVGHCRDASVPVFVKQLGSRPVVSDDTCSLERAIREGGYELRSRKGSDPSEWPEDLRIRQWSEVQS